MAHAVAPHLREGDLDAALLADDAAILHPLVLAAQALVILDRPEDAGAEQAVALRLEGAVVDRLGLLDLAVGPRADALGAGDRDADLVEALRPRNLPEDVHQLIHKEPLRHSWRVYRKPMSFRSAISEMSPRPGLTGLTRPSTSWCRLSQEDGGGRV